MDERATQARRRWFQFRLSTLVVVMIAASVLVWVNVVEREVPFTDGDLFERGWPFRASQYYKPNWPWDPEICMWQGLMGDIAIAILIIGLTGALFEFIARRLTS